MKNKNMMKISKTNLVRHQINLTKIKKIKVIDMTKTGKQVKIINNH